MTLENQNRATTSFGNGVTRNWPFLFPVYDETTLSLLLIDAATGETLEVVSPGEYIVTGIGEAAGGTIEYPISPIAPLTSAYGVIALRTVPYTQQADINNQGGFHPNIIEQQLDRIVMQTQQLADELAHTVKVDQGMTPITVTELLLLVDETEANAALAQTAATQAEGWANDAEAAADAAEAAAAVSIRYDEAQSLTPGEQTQALTNIGMDPYLADLAGKIDSTEKGAALGVAPLDASGKVDSSYLPVNGAYKGTWDANTNTPTITSGVGVNGDFYIVGTAGTTTVDGVSSWALGDQIRFNGTVWQKIANFDSVQSVAGKTGVVTLVKGDVGLGNVDNTSDANKPVSTAQQTALDGKVPTTRTVTAGTGLQGGGPLSSNLTLSLSIASQDSLLLADTAMQPGDFGIGLIGNATSIANLDATDFVSGKFRAPSSTPGTWPTTANSAVVEYSRYSTTGGMMTLTYVLGEVVGNKYERVLAGGVWGPWRRVNVADHIIMPEDFGAVGDGSTNDDVPMLAWFEEVKAGKYGICDGTKNYFMTQGFSSADVDIVICGNGARITKTNESRHFTINNTFADMFTSGLTLVSNTYDFGGGAIPVTRVQRAGGWSAYAVGDIVKIGTDAVIPTDETTNREAEWAQVGAISGTDLILTHRLIFPTGANPIIGRIRKDIRVDISDLELDQTGFTDTTAWDLDRLRIQATYMPSLRNVHVLHAAAQGFTFASCYMHQTIACSASNCRTYTAGSAFGYGVVSKASAYGTHIGLRILNCRHGFTTVCQTTAANNGNLVDRGRNCHERIIGGTAFGCTNAAWDTHADSFNTEFHGCSAVATYLPVGGERMNYELRGIGDRAVGCTSLGGRGFFINRHESQSWVQQNWYCEVIDCTHTSSPSDPGTDHAFRAHGDAGTPLSGERFVNCTHIRNGSSAASFEIGHAEVLVINPKILGAVLSSGNVFDFRALDGGRYIIRGGFIDHRGSDAGASFRIFRGDEPGTYFDVKGLDLKTISGQLAAVVNAVDAAGGKDVTANIRMTSNVVQSAMTIVGTQLAATRIFIDIQDDVEGTFNSNHQSQTFGSTGNKSLSINRRGGDQLFYAITTSASGVVINDIDDGARIGQVLIIQNRSSSANSLVVASVANVTHLGGNVTLAAGDALRLVWDASGVWVKG